jgi:hypothetical protein
MTGASESQLSSRSGDSMTARIQQSLSAQTCHDAAAENTYSLCSPVLLSACVAVGGW